jgi:hypothetical protein
MDMTLHCPDVKSVRCSTAKDSVIRLPIDFQSKWDLGGSRELLDHDGIIGHRIIDGKREAFCKHAMIPSYPDVNSREGLEPSDIRGNTVDEIIAQSRRFSFIEPPTSIQVSQSGASEAGFHVVPPSSERQQHPNHGFGAIPALRADDDVQVRLNAMRAMESDSVR